MGNRKPLTDRQYEELKRTIQAAIPADLSQAEGEILLAESPVLRQKIIQAMREIISARQEIRLVEKVRSLFLPACYGTLSFLHLLRGSYDGWADPAIKTLKPELKATSKTRLNIFNILKLATCIQAFKSIDENLANLCLTQHQIMAFMKGLSGDELNYNYYFLFKSDDDVLVALFSGHQKRFSQPDVYLYDWNAANNLACQPDGYQRLVVPVKTNKPKF